jgi:23S rRNA pseudouridine955/2504/2580 synthase
MKTVNFKELILFEDKDYILINKPAHISTLEERQNNAPNIHGLAKAYWPESQVCHRLDKETSGVLAIAKNSEAYRNLAMQFEGREVNKVYHAIVEGIHEFQNERIDLPILASTVGTVKIARNGKPAETYFSTLKAFKKHSLVECRPVTGRMHQIRIHLKALSAPIVGDIQYGASHLYLSEIKKRFNLKNDTEELPLIQRVALHAYSLEFKSLNKEIIKVTAPYPKDFGVLFKQLEKYS